MNRLTGIILRRDNAGERHLRLAVLDAEHGVVTVHYKPANKRGTATVTPDIFDEAEIFSDPPKPGTHARFAREYRLIRRRAGLARDYGRLTLAARLASLLADNPHPPESMPALLELARAAFDALEHKPHPEITRLKTLWLIARDEGWPVKEDFAENLPAGLAEALPSLVRSPLADLSESDNTTAKAIAERLENWLTREAHFVIRAP